MDPKKEALDQLEIVEEIVLDCCNDPKNGPTNCLSLVRTSSGFALVGDDGHVEKLSYDQMEQLVEDGAEMLDHVD